MDTYGLIGYPLGHSFSQGFFTEKFRKERICAEYRNFEIRSIADFPRIVNDTPSLRGLNVTIPYKQEVMRYLDALSPEAESIGAVNVVRVERTATGTARLVGHNSDVTGFVESIRPLLLPHHTKALILGTGGAARAIHHGLTAMLGLDARFVSRTPREGALTYADLTPDTVHEYEVVVNCTPCGMSPHTDECPALPYSAMSERNLLFDLIYNPAETLFMRQGAAHGAVTKNGLEMLHIQAVKSWFIWNGDGSPCP